MNKNKNRNSCNFFSGACLMRVYEISNDDLLQLFEIVLYNQKRYTLRKEYMDEKYILCSRESKLFYFETIIEALAYIINTNNVF